jgi:hypothetical protein
MGKSINTKTNSELANDNKNVPINASSSQTPEKVRNIVS